MRSADNEELESSNNDDEDDSSSNNRDNQREQTIQHLLKIKSLENSLLRVRPE